MTRDGRWLNGLAFLWKNEDYWPGMIKVPALKDSDAEVRKEGQIYATTVVQDPLDDLIHYYSSWWKLKKAFAWLLRYRQFL